MKEFDKIIGYKNIKIELERICDIMVNSEKYRKLGVNTPRGLLIHGDPGLGKTLMAKCLIAESGRPVFTCRKDKPDGDFVKEIKKIFEEAKENAPSIVFLDDMDKFANEDEHHRNAEEFITVQSCIDDCKGAEVFALATANDLDNLPKSLLRAGRFDKSIEVEAPKGEDAAKIIGYYLSQKKFVADIASDEIARILYGVSCAELETVINEAGVYAGYDNKSVIELDDILRAAMRVIFDAPENLTVVDENDLLAIAYHEAGHAVIAEVLEPGSVSIVSVLSHSGRTGGVTSYYQQNEKYFLHKKYMENRVLSLLGGKAATEIVYGEVDTGANNDLHRAFDIVERFVDNYCSTGFDCFESRSSSNDLRARRDVNISAEMGKYYSVAKKILIENRAFLDTLAHVLVEKKTVLNKEIDGIKKRFSIVAA